MAAGAVGSRGFSREVRIGLAVVLTVGALVSGWFTFRVTADQTVAEYTAAVRAHEVTWVGTSGSGPGQSALWSTGVLHWYRTHANDSGQGGTSKDADLRAIASSAGLTVHSEDSRFWWLNVPGGVLAIAAVVAFLGMLRFGGTWVGNRWYWLWMCTVGQIGLIFYLLLEPEPIRPWVGRALSFFTPPTTATRPHGGFTGFTTAVLTAIALLLVGAGIYIFAQALVAGLGDH